MAKRKIEKIKLDNIELDAVVTEAETKNADVTNRPVEQGEDVQDHMKVKPYDIRLTGTMVNDAMGKIDIIEGFQKEAKLLTYTGRRQIKNLVITSFSTKFSKDIKDAYDYDLSLQEVNIAKPDMFKLNVANPVSKKPNAKTTTKVKSLTNEGRKQVQKR